MGLGEMYGSVMSLYDLADDLKTEAMFYIVSRFLRAGYGFVLVQLLQSVFAHSYTIICNGEDAGAIFQSYRKYDPAARWVVDHAVADEVGKHPPKQEIITGQSDFLSRLLLGTFQVILVRHLFIEDPA